MIDPCITDRDFGRDFLGGKGQKTARRLIVSEGIPRMKIRGHWLIKLSDAEAWRAARLQRPAATDLKSLLKEISERALARRVTA
jgi:hypothetical protein